jgi:hypothetical protein
VSDYYGSEAKEQPNGPNENGSPPEPPAFVARESRERTKSAVSASSRGARTEYRIYPSIGIARVATARTASSSALKHYRFRTRTSAVTHERAPLGKPTNLHG